ncbi:MAG TPA: hypothetical protein VMP13_02035 [Acidimicrobiia bacterium]|nr:hypothetical protein [Acidimicrobiia bacterium]
MRRSTALTLVPIAVLVTACSTFVGETPDDTRAGSDGPTSTSDDDPGSTTEPSSAGCVRFTGDHSSPIDTGALATDALHLSGEAFICADDVVIVTEGDLNEVAAAAQLAAAVAGPLLFPDPRLAAELGRLDARRVHLIGEPEVNVPSGAERIEHDVISAVEWAQVVLGTEDEVRVPAVPDSSTIVETVLAIDSRSRVILPQVAPNTTTTTSGPDLDETEIVSGLAVATESTSVWMVDAGKPRTILLAAAVGRTLGASVVAIDGEDVLGYPEVGVALDGRPAGATRFIGGAPEASGWELAALANGQQLPGGGFYILPRDQKRRYLAYYGHPESEALGALGQQQGPAQTLEVMQDLVEAYTGDGAQVIPTFEMIASVASAGPTDDGNYSYEWPVETFRPWVDFAGENEMYVILDLQPGRSNFLSQAVRYEELLREPHVGLALDPEWRLLPDQVHLEQIGSVEAAEVNGVIDWVADLVRDNGLPQKMLIVHQFQNRMIQNRQDLIDRPEIQVIIQMDGEGSEPLKDATWGRLLQGAEDAHWAWGWKNFFVRDEGGPPSPESTMGKEPSPVYVSYQ